MTFTIRGMPFHNNIPGEGRVAQDTGVRVRVTLVRLRDRRLRGGALLHSGGKHPPFEDIDWCSMVD